MNQNGKRDATHAAQTHATCATRQPIRHAAIVAALLIAIVAALCGAWTQAAAQANVQAQAHAENVKIEIVPESEFEPIGYEASIDFDEIDIVEGFEEVPDLGIYFDHRYSDDEEPSLDDLYLQVKDRPGLAFAIDESTKKGSGVLRYTGGMYKGEPFDAIVTLADWTYLEPDCGWAAYEPFYSGHEKFQPGVYLSTHWKSLSDGPEGFQNFNFYTLGIEDLAVRVEFVRAGTDEPIEVKGHATCIDLDTTQAFEFGGAIVGARIAEGNDVLYLENDGTRVASEHVYLSTDGWKHPEEYKKGLVETFYDTTGDNRGTPAEFRFFSGWRESELDAGNYPDPQGFFALTPDFLTAPNPEENPDGQTDVVKSADKTEGVQPGDEVEYTIDFKAHEQGVNCRVGYRYSALEIVDTLPAEMSYVDGSARLVDENGEPIENAGVATVERATGDESAEGPNEEGGGSANDESGEQTDPARSGIRNVAQSGPSGPVVFAQTDAAMQLAQARGGDQAAMHGESGEASGEEAAETGDPDAEGTESVPTGDLVRFTFDKEFLTNMPMKGEHYRLVFKAKLDRYPADGSMSVMNSSYAMINSTGKTPSNDVETKLVKPALSIEKASDKHLYEAGETALYTLAVSQAEEGMTAENVVVKDLLNSADAGSIVEGSVKAAKGDDEPEAVEPLYLRDDEDRIVGFEYVSGMDLAYGETMTLTYKVAMEKPGSTIANTATTWADNADEADAENEVEIADEQAEVPAKPEEPGEPLVTLEKSVDKDEAPVGGDVAYLVRATVEDADATNVVISDDSLPEGMPIDAESIEVMLNGKAAKDVEPAIKDNGFSVAFDTLHDGDTVEITYTALVEDEALAGTDVVNTALLTADELDKPLSSEAVVAIAELVDDEKPDDKPAAAPSAPVAPDKPADAPPSSPATPGKFIKTGDATMALIAGTVGTALLAAAAAAIALKRKRTSGNATHSQALARATRYGSADSNRTTR